MSMRRPASSTPSPRHLSHRWSGLFLPIALGWAFAGEVIAQDPRHVDHALGSVSFPVSCSAAAQVEFDHAIALLHHMTYPQARAAFQQVSALDPRCAMAHWGYAMTLFQPLWPTRPNAEALKRGWDAVERAKSLAPPTELERSFIAAAEAFFLEPASPDYWLRIRRWERAMATAYSSFPDSPEVASFFALAHLATARPDTVTRANADRAAGILLRVHERHPDHPGAMHYLVHANDVPTREGESLDVTRRYDAVAPRNPHALHMPTHIYTRLGDWDGVIRGNLLAAEAALAHPAGEQGELVWDEFPHAIEYLVYAHLQQGADDLAAAEVRRLHGTPRLEPTMKTAFHLASTRARLALERRAWDEAARIVPREPATLNWDRFAWPEAVGVFARGLGSAHLGALDDARAALTRLEVLEDTTTKVGETLFARSIRVLRLELEAWLTHAEGSRHASVALMREASALEASTPKHALTPGPTLPADELLGDLLMVQGQHQQALASYQRSLAAYPRRFNSLFGAARAARESGDAALARTYYGQLLDVAPKGSRRSALAEAQRYLREHP